MLELLEGESRAPCPPSGEGVAGRPPGCVSRGQFRLTDRGCETREGVVILTGEITAALWGFIKCCLSGFVMLLRK